MVSITLFYTFSGSLAGVVEPKSILSRVIGLSSVTDCRLWQFHDNNSMRQLNQVTSRLEDHYIKIEYS
jgi:hypothetical protein